MAVVAWKILDASEKDQIVWFYLQISWFLITLTNESTPNFGDKITRNIYWIAKYILNYRELRIIELMCWFFVLIILLLDFLAHAGTEGDDWSWTTNEA